MIVERANNGWPGIWMPGDEALALADMMEMVSGTEDWETIKFFLTTTAQKLRACKAKNQEEAIDPPDDNLYRYRPRHAGP